MSKEIRRIHLDLAGDIGFRDFEPGDLIMAKQRMGAGYYTAVARVFAVGEDWIQVQCHNDFPAVDRLDWVRVGNDTDPNRRAFIRLAGSGEGSPRQEFRARIASFEDLKSIDTLVMLEGDLNGVQHPVMGALEGDGVLCTNLYAVGKLWVKVGDELKEAGAEFKVQSDLIESKVSQKEFDTLSGTVTAQGTAITQTASAIALKAESSTVDAMGERVTQAEASIRVNSEAITQTVRKGDIISSINQSAEQVKIEASKIRLIGDTTLDGMLSAGKIKAEYIDADNLIARKLSTGTTGARIEINHEPNVISITNSDGENIFKVGPYTGAGDDPYLRVGNSVTMSRFGIGTGRILIGEDTIAFGGYSPFNLLSMEIRSPNGYTSSDPTTIWIANLPTDVDVPHLKAGTIYVNRSDRTLKLA